MKIVVDLPEELTAKDKFYTDKEVRTIIKSVQNGTPLPERHGRLIDADALKQHIMAENNITELEYACCYDYGAYIEDAPTIIGAAEEGGKDDSTS